MIIKYTILKHVKPINYQISEERYLKFKISTDSLLEIVEGKKHPEDLLFNEKVKISGDISILA
jgi:predicted lipid carrier protein YhbT